MTCPFCKQEFPFDNGGLDREISEIGQRITTINRRLSEINHLPPYRRTRETWNERRRLASELARLQEKIAGLKSVRKATDQQIKAFEFQEFKNIVKERFGEAEYRKILDEVQQELKAYQISGLMRHEYTRSPHKSSVTSINKL